MSPGDSEQARLWSKFARSDLNGSSADSQTAVRYKPRHWLGSLLLACARSRVFTYATGDVPKENWLRRALRDTGENLLDVGVRTGDLAAMFQRWGKRVYGIDIASEYVEHCRQSGVIVDGAVCDVLTDPIPVPASFSPDQPDQYDTIFLGEILEHLLDARGVFARLAKVCRPGGHLILTTPNLAYLGNRIRVPLGRDLHRLTMDRGEVGHQHIRVYTARLLRRLLAEAGFEVVDIGSDGVVVRLQRFIDLEYDSPSEAEHSSHTALMVVPFTDRPFPTLGRTIYIKARRG